MAEATGWAVDTEAEQLDMTARDMFCVAASELICWGRLQVCYACGYHFYLYSALWKVLHLSTMRQHWRQALVQI